MYSYLVIASNLAQITSLKFTCNNIVMLAYLEAKIGIKYNLLVSIFSNFPGGYAPRPP